MLAFILGHNRSKTCLIPQNILKVSIVRTTGKDKAAVKDRIVTFATFVKVLSRKLA